MNNNFNGGFNQGQVGFQPSGAFNPTSNQAQNNDGRRNAYSHVKMQVIAHLVDDPKSEVINNDGTKVASATIAVNHRGQNGATDYWDIEVWANQGGSTSSHDFLVDYCKKGRQLFIEGVPHLKRRKRQNNGQDVLDQNGKAVYDYYPTIRVTSLMGLGGGNNSQNNNGNNNNAQQQGGFQQQSQQNGFQAQGGFQGQPQGNFQPQNGGFGAPNGAPNGQFGAPVG